MNTSKKTRQQLQLLRDEALDAYLNREDFHFDLNADALYRYYKDRYVEQGKKAMEDTMGQASALTGGYGSSYAQNVGQQAYGKSLEQLGDVVPALYQLAYDRYREEGETLYQTYQNWAQQEQETADREYQDQLYELAYKKYELEERKRQDENTRFLLKTELQTGNTSQNNQGAAAPQGDYYAWLSYHQGKSTMPVSDDAGTAYDNGTVSTGNVMTMQRVLGLKETGKWTEEDRAGAGGLTADEAWLSYQKGQLQNYKSVGLGLPVGNIKTMERVLGLEEDGYWSKEDQKAAGGRTASAAWKDYQQGKLQSRSKTGMTVDAWAAHQSQQPRSSVTAQQPEAAPAVQDFIVRMVTEDQAAERGINPTEWKMMVIDRLNRVNMTAEEFAQLEKYYGLDIPGSVIPQDSTAQKMSYAEYRQKTAAQKVDALNTAIQQYFNLYQAFANSAAYDVQYIDYDNAASMLKNRNRIAKELRKRANTLTSALRMNGDIIGSGNSELLTQIKSTQTGVDGIVDVYDDYAQYYSQWATKDEYQRAKEYYDTWGHYVNADDFDYYSAKGAAIQNPTVGEAEGYFNFFGWRPFAEDVGNIVTYSRDNYAKIVAISEGGRYDVVGDIRYNNMTDDEVAIYNYLLAKEGKERAGEFLSYLDDMLNAREGKRIAQCVTSIDIPILEELAIGLYGFGAGVDNWVSGVKQFFTNEQQPPTITQYANAEIANSLSGFGKYAYQGANVLGNMAPPLVLSYLTKGLGAPAALSSGVSVASTGISAAGNAYGSALRDGYSVGQARVYSTLVGAAEAALQYLLDGNQLLGGGVVDELIEAKINMIDNSLLRISAKLGVDTLSEITEEELQNFLEPAFRTIVFGEEYDAPTVDELIETAIVTALSTPVLGGAVTVSEDLYVNRQLAETGKNNIPPEGSLNAPVNPINEVADISSGKMENTLPNQINKVNQKTTDSEVVQPSETIQTTSNQTNTAVNPEEVANSLRSEGISFKKADRIADAVTARLNGQELTRKQRGILRSALDSPTVQSVISEFVQKKTDVVDSAQGNVYDKDGVAGDLANSEEAALWDLAYQKAGIDQSEAPGMIRGIESLSPEAFPAAQRRELTAEANAFGVNDYVTVMGDSTDPQVQTAVSERNYGSGTDILGDIKRTSEIVVEFHYSSKYDKVEFARQLADQQKGMNELTVQEYLDNRQKYIEHGRTIESNAAQQAAREKAFADKVNELQDAGLSLKEADEQAKEWLDTQAALHVPDQVAGGYASNVGGVGDKGVNSSIGAQWRYRISSVDEQIQKMAEHMSAAGKKTTYLNVNLIYKEDG